MKTKHVKQIAAGCLSIGMLGASIVLAASSPDWAWAANAA